MSLPSSNNQSAGPADNQGTLFLFLIGILASLFVTVGSFGPNGFLPFGMIVTGIAIQWKLKVKSNINPATGFNSKALGFITGGIILILTINLMLNAVFRVSFLQPPLSASALSYSAQFSDIPIYIYNSLFAISEEYLFRGVLLYFILSYAVKLTSGMLAQWAAVAGSSLAWMIFHFFVYGNEPLILAFVFFSGVVFGFITVYSRNILAASAIHITNNLVAAGLTVIDVTTVQLLGVLL